MNMINTSQCENCEYGTINEIYKAKVKVLCSYKEKEYYYGACIPCDFYKKRKKE